MGKSGPEFYDDEAVFATYMTGRESRLDNPNDTLEKPIFDELVGNLRGLRILDLGCGSGGFGLEALERGGQSYVGIDGSENMARAAQKKLAGTRGQVICASMETWDYPSRQFDLVTSRLALHYVAEIEPVFVNVHRALTEGGRFVFSVEHPVITSCDRGWQTKGPRQDWIVDDYFRTGARQTKWMGGEVIKYHRTVEDYFIALQSAGFRIDSLRESRPQRARFHEEATYERRMRIPLMLFFSACRASAELPKSP